jgi:two-component system CheB/CheR fusion protein
MIAIGASAGGLEALEKFFDFVPDDSGFVWVVIQHLDPNFRSVMDELLGRHSRLRIRKVEDGMPIEPNVIYLNPARHDMSIDGGVFRVRPSEKTGGLNLPINSFLESAAAQFGAKAVGVILSGTGSDGTKGCEAIKAAGGLVFVQEPSSAKFDSMPASVIARELADGVDSPENLPAMILGANVGARRQSSHRTVTAGDADPFATIFSIVKTRNDIDFSVYKPATMERRIRRRMGLVGYTSLTDYADMLSIDRDEATSLVKDLLLDVTAFFRDADAYGVLSEKAIGPLVDRMTQDREIRIWVAGCSSGEEAYSIAIAFAECARQRGCLLNLKILATDIYHGSLAAASSGLYSEAALAACPAGLVERYFDREGESYRIKKAIRRLIVFSQHNLLKDPPFARIDLLTCRNVLIYFNEDAQNQALSLFHFSLVKGGVIMLGPSESLGSLGDEFRVVSQKWRIFSKTRDARLLGPGAIIARHGGHSGLSAPSLDGGAIRGAMAPTSRDMLRATNGALREMLVRYAPPGFLLSRDGTLLHVFGNATRYLTLKQGAFSQKIVDLLPREIALLVANGLGGASKDAFVRYRRSIRRMTEAGEKLEIVAIEPLSDAEAVAEYLLLTIDSREPEVRPVEAAAAEDSAKSLDETFDLRRRNEELRADLQSTEENLQSAIEELATSNEEIQSTNEELMASNEELQSTNEELHSVNEELYTVSAEHQRKIDELVQLTMDMEHLLKSTEIGTIFLDEKMYVRRFTPAAAEAFNLIPQDVGRPITHITFRFERVDFLAQLDEVNRTREVREQEVSVDGRAFLLRILPYRADGTDLHGAVVTVIDVDALKKAQSRVRELDRRNQAVLSTLTETILSWDATTETILFCNDAFAATIDTVAEQLIGRRLRDVMSAERYVDPQAAMADLVAQKTVERHIRYHKANGDIVWRSVVYTRMEGEDGATAAYLACGRDISEQVRYVTALEELSALETPIDESFETFARTALTIGSQFLGLSYGLLSEVDAEHHRTVSYVGPGLSTLREGIPVFLPHDLCQRVCTADRNGLCLFKTNEDCDTAASRSVVESGLAEVVDASLCDFVLAETRIAAQSRDERPVHVSDLGGNLHSYIGMQVRASGRTFGTVSFFAERPGRFGPISELQLGFVRLLARWIGLKIDAHRQHQALLKSEAELQLMFDSVPQSIWHIDATRTVRRANAAAAATMRCSTDEAVGARIDDFMTSVDCGWMEDGRSVLETQTPRRGVVERRVDPTIGTRWISTDIIPHRDKVSGEKSILVVANDITASKERETDLEALAAQIDGHRKRFEQHYRQTPAMMCSFGPDGLLLEVSDLFLQKTGYGRDEVVGRHLNDLLEPGSRARADELLPELWQGGSCSDVPLFILSKSGRTIEIELSGFLNQETDGTKSCLAILIDVTTRNDATRALERANRDLATSNEGLKKFAHIASHDLQEPLRKISQFGDMLTQDFGEALDDDGKFYISVMRDSADRMRQLVRDILTFSKSVNATFERVELPLVELIAELVEEFGVSVGEARAQFDVAPLPRIDGDRTAVQLLFRNLLSNGLKYRREGVDLVIGITGSWSDQGAYVIRIRDNGCGFDARFRETIFDPFTRLHTRNEVGGTGIGLAICKSVCERHNWTISADGEPGVGAEFTIVLPAADVRGPSPRR